MVFSSIQIYNLKKYISLSLLLFCVLNSDCFGQNPNFRQQAYLLVKTVEKHHYNPRTLDEDFSESVFNNFLQLLDPNALYLTIEEINELKKNNTSIAQEILNQECTFLNEIKLLYEKKLMFSDSLLNTFRYQKFDFEKPDTIVLKSQMEFLNSELLIKRWQKLIKLKVLSLVYNSDIDSLNAMPELTSEELSEKTDIALDSERCRMKSKFDSEGSIDNYIGNIYLKAIASAYDPHTKYFSLADQEEFNSFLSKETFSFGFEVAKNDLGEIEIIEIIPGSPAWNSNKLNEGDIILQVNINGITKKLDCIEPWRLAKLLSADNIVEAEFLIRKSNTSQIHLKLHKDKVDVVDNVIKSFILTGERKIGYIYLPSFYSQMNAAEYAVKGCANDVAKELIKLKQEGINGLILDLRNNGGGSMLEALLMAGIFIDRGAVGIIQKREAEPETLKDFNRGTIFNGPLCLLINEYSASASELFSAAMQDHNRAIIVGSKSYGKSTSQEIITINSKMLPIEKESAAKPQAYLKLTKGVFYRVTGESHQKQGVIPDILLPSLYEGVAVNENSHPLAIDANSITKKTYYYPLAELPLDQLKKLSEARLENDSVFKEIRKQNQIAIDQKNQISIPLNSSFFYEFISIRSTSGKPKNLSGNYLVENPGYLKGVSSITDPGKEIYEKSMQQIKEDVYIGETFNVINNLIDLKIKTE